MENKQEQVGNYLEKLSPTQLVADQKVSKKFIGLYDAIHGKGLGEAIYHKEQFNFVKLLNDNPTLAQCSKMSLYGCFLDVAVNGLSLDNTSRPLCYLIPRDVKTGRKDQQTGRDIYEKRASVSITGYGELVMRKRAGHINYADNPVVVYDGDLFEAGLDASGAKFVKYTARTPRKSNKIVGAFIRIVRNDGSVDYQWMLEADIDRLKRYSERANSKWDTEKKQRIPGAANALYSSNDGQIDPGFLENKMIKHAFDAYPKIRIGEFSSLETEETKAPVIDYGFGLPENNNDTQDAHAEDVTNKAEAFGETKEPEKAGVTVNDESETF
jgi:hypothetical protein